MPPWKHAKIDLGWRWKGVVDRHEHVKNVRFEIRVHVSRDYPNLHEAPGAWACATDLLLLDPHSLDRGLQIGPSQQAPN